ncbi:hypothetical protein [Thomasclavelia cocleata]|uniref:hypothetical protein n=1 Tax=Thomasclavelia cocleata TaxID=69824 RepID=UPI00258C0570|nr:hypothetical protein [Thomasclavelia cocleata]
MNNEDVLKEINSIIKRCKNAQQKFNEGTSQNTLLKNRINALCVSKSLIEKNKDKYLKKDYEEALLPIMSIINKCQKAQGKYAKDTCQYNQYIKMIKTMNISKELIEEELLKSRE